MLGRFSAPIFFGILKKVNNEAQKCIIIRCAEIFQALEKKSKRKAKEKQKNFEKFEKRVDNEGQM